MPRDARSPLSRNLRIKRSFRVAIHFDEKRLPKDTSTTVANSSVLPSQLFSDVSPELSNTDILQGRTIRVQCDRLFVGPYSGRRQHNRRSICSFGGTCSTTILFSLDFWFIPNKFSHLKSQAKVHFRTQGLKLSPPLSLKRTYSLVKIH